MSRGMKITIAVIALLIICFAVALCAVLLIGDNKDSAATGGNAADNSTENSSALYITAFESVNGGFRVIYSDGSKKDFLYPTKEEAEKPEEKAYVISIAYDKNTLVITYSNGAASLLPISTKSTSSSSGGSTSNSTTDSSSLPSGKYVTAIFDEGDGNLSVRYSDGTSDTIKKDDIEIEENDEVYITKVEQTDTGIKVTYSDGTSGSITSVGDSGVVLDDIYNSYKEFYSTNISLEEFLKKFLTVSGNINDVTNTVTADRLRSTIKIFTEFAVKYGSSWGISYGAGSGAIWKIYNDYTYIVTCYHVVYEVDAYLSQNNGSYIARGIYASLYGNEGEATQVGSGYSYGNSFKCEYVGGAITLDLAVIRVATSTIKAVNPDIQEIVCAENYHVGETAIAIGNPLGEGICVTKGIVCKENEDCYISIDNTVRTYRSIRTDVAVYTGNSGGGLYNSKGELIGIINGARGDDQQNISFVIPLSIVSGFAESTIYNDRDNDAATKGAYTLNIGAALTAKDTRYVYDPVTGYGKVKGKVFSAYIAANSFLKQINIDAGDIFYSIIIDKKEYLIDNIYDITEALYHVRVGSKISVTTLNESTGETVPHGEITIAYSDLVSVE